MGNTALLTLSERWRWHCRALALCREPGGHRWEPPTLPLGPQRGNGATVSGGSGRGACETGAKRDLVCLGELVGIMGEVTVAFL